MVWFGFFLPTTCVKLMMIGQEIQTPNSKTDEMRIIRDCINSGINNS